MTKCVICEERPSRKSNGFCSNCDDKIKSESKSRQPVKPFRYVTYRGHVVGMFPSADGALQSRLLGISAKRLPKTITLDLNTYLDGFDRETIKRLKATVLQLAHA